MLLAKAETYSFTRKSIKYNNQFLTSEDSFQDAFKIFCKIDFTHAIGVVA